MVTSPMMSALGATHPLTLKRGYNVGKVQDKTGWYWIPLYDGNSMWLCPDCWKRALKAAAEMLDVLKTDIFGFSRFSTELNKAKEKP